MFTVTGGEGLAERLEALNFLPIIEAEIIRGIRKNVSEGLDAGGSSFAKYVSPYEKWRANKGLTVSKVNLRVKSEDSLLDTLGARRIDEKNSEISVKEDREKVAEGLSNKRHFMGVTSGAITAIEQKLEEEFERMLQ